jgi:hypothetical protein
MTKRLDQLDAGLITEATAALQRGRDKDAFKLIDSARKSAVKCNDEDALRKILLAVRGTPGPTGASHEKKWERLIYALEQNIALVSRRREHEARHDSHMQELQARKANGMKKTQACRTEPMKELETRQSDGRKERHVSRVSLAPLPAAIDSLDGAETGLEPVDNQLRSGLDGLAGELDAREKRLISAQAEVKAAQKARDQRIAAARKALEKAGQSRKLAGGFLAGFRSAFGEGQLEKVTLYDDAIKTPEGRRKLTSDVQARVDTAGNLMVTRRHTLTRFALLGPFSVFTPKSVKHGDNELYLLIESQTWASVVKCDPKEGVQARKIAQAINLAAPQAGKIRTQRRFAVARAKQVLTEEEAEDSELREAEREFDSARSDIEPIPALLARVETEASQMKSGRLRRRAEKVISKGQVALDEAQRALAEQQLARAEIEAKSLAAARADFISLLGARVHDLTVSSRANDVGDDAPGGSSEYTGRQTSTGRISLQGQLGNKVPSQGEKSTEPEPAVGRDRSDPLEAIKRLAELRDVGAISEEEFLHKKTELLRRV